MNEIFYRIIAVVVGYVFGLFQTGYIYGKLNNVDIRDFGSGNAGTTNAMRVLGKKAGIITYIGDTFKAILAGITMRLLCQFVFGIEEPSFVFLIILYTGFGVVLGHNFPFYMGFKGGKGIAASSGVIMALADWKLIALGLLTFIAVALIFRFVSLASIVMMIGFFAEVILFGCLNMIPVTGNFTEIIIITGLVSGLAVFRHRSNIGRLLNGTERRIGEKKNK